MIIQLSTISYGDGAMEGICSSRKSRNLTDFSVCLSVLVCPITKVREASDIERAIQVFASFLKVFYMNKNDRFAR